MNKPINRQLDLRCYNEPIPVIRAYRMLNTPDCGTQGDFPVYCTATGNKLLPRHTEDGAGSTSLVCKPCD